MRAEELIREALRSAMVGVEGRRMALAEFDAMVERLRVMEDALRDGMTATDPDVAPPERAVAAIRFRQKVAVLDGGA